MKKLIAIAILAMSACAIAGTNVITHTAAEVADRQKRIMEWRETWAKMTTAEKNAHREAQRARLQAAREEAKARSGKREVKRTKEPDGSIVIQYDDGSVLIHQFIHQLPCGSAK